MTVNSYCFAIFRTMLKQKRNCATIKHKQWSAIITSIPETVPLLSGGSLATGRVGVFLITVFMNSSRFRTVLIVTVSTRDIVLG